MMMNELVYKIILEIRYNLPKLFDIEPDIERVVANFIYEDIDRCIDYLLIKFYDEGLYTLQIVPRYLEKAYYLDLIFIDRSGAEVCENIVSLIYDHVSKESFVTSNIYRVEV